MIGAVQRVIQSSAQSARNGNITSRKWISVAAGHRSCRRRCSGEREQFDDLPAIQWKIQDAGVLDDLADTDASRFHQSGIRLYFDLLAHLSDFEDRIDRPDLR